ncbi:hypothetical protein E2F43_14680 [Seongchinamella unica]|uniref:HdeD family acid-resistance protein n=1 Tax=Seongchinamella unica TaxID=2547392 RepID=A0A4R5LQN8_9GAMM|nr:DUF308 domain-containing protein [Seongchinamella unica]TDG12805.1 hypothetical protein E2F43_14680 [Seongchinamella unica]
MSIVEYLKDSAKSARWTGIALVVLGFLSLVAPLAAGLSITLLVGILVSVSGLLQLGLVFRAGSIGRGLLLLLFGALALVVGIYMVAQPAVGLANLTLILAAYFIASGIIELVAAIQARPDKGWGWFAFSAVLSVVLGIMIWRQFPFSGIWAVGTLVGIRLLSSGFILLSVGSAGKEIVREAQK